MTVVLDCEYVGTNGAEMSTTSATVGTLTVKTVGTHYIQSNRLYPDAVYGRLKSAQTLPSNYSLRTTIRLIAAGNGTFDMAQLFVRCNTAVTIYYVLNVTQTGWELRRANGGAESVVASGSFSLSAATDYVFDLSYNAGVIKVYQDGSQIGSTYTDGSPLSANDIAGYAWYTDSSSAKASSGWHLDRFVLDDSPTGSGGGGSSIAAISSGAHLRSLNR